MARLVRHHQHQQWAKYAIAGSAVLALVVNIKAITSRGADAAGKVVEGLKVRPQTQTQYLSSAQPDYAQPDYAQPEYVQQPQQQPQPQQRPQQPNRRNKRSATQQQQPGLQ